MNRVILMKIYYAHFIGIYNTKQEERDLDTIKLLFPIAEIVNPNSKENEELYKSKGMNLFFELVNDCDILVFRGCVNGKIPAGVMKEIKYTKEKYCMSIIELPTFINREMTVDDTRNMLSELGVR